MVHPSSFEEVRLLLMLQQLCEQLLDVYLSFGLGTLTINSRHFPWVVVRDALPK